MSWSVNFFLLFVFVYTASGIPLGGNPERKESLSSSLIPSQWGKDSEISYRWPKGVVPYLFDDQSYDDGVKDRVRTVMAALERDSCIRFKEWERDGEGSWLHFTNPGALRHCFHEPIYQSNGEIQVILGYDCLRLRDIMHTLLHAIGFRDEVSHPQRDLFVKIMWGNIQPAYKHMFRIQSVNNAGGLVEYDPMSIMHFHDRAYSLNGQATITPLLPGLKIAPSDKLSHLDKMKLRIIFGHECNKRKVGEVLNKCKGILTQYNETELTTTKPEDNNPLNNEDANGDGGNHDDRNASGNNGDQKENGDGVQETIVLGNDVNNNEEGDPNAIGNNGDQKENGDGEQETIVVGNDVNNNEEGYPNAFGNSGNQKENGDGEQETIVVGNDVNNNEEGDPNAIGNSGNQKENGDGEQETIVVGNDVNNNEEGDPNAIGNNGDQKENGDRLDETIAVGNDVSSNGIQETIIVGNDEDNGNTNKKDDVDDNKNKDPENVDPVEVDKNVSTIESIIIDADVDMIIDDHKENNSINSEDEEEEPNNNNDNQDANQPNEVIVVGNEHKSGDVFHDNKGGNEAIIVGNDEYNKNKDGPDHLKRRNN